MVDLSEANRRYARKDRKIVLATLALHNYLNQTDNAHYTPAGFIDSEDSTGEKIAGQ